MIILMHLRHLVVDVPEFVLHVTVQPGALFAGGLEKLHTMDILHHVIIVIQMDVVRNAWVKD
ncbi:MAG: hypothetical protein BHV77_20160 [Bacteroides sp. 43_108]|nr:MAG: hypothetical protein BHV77_20160 [Bacteroides sp. 43_108]